METRKIQVTGKSTYIMTLPKKWATRSNLCAGSQVKLNLQDNGALLITPNSISEEKGKKILHLNGDIQRFKRDLIATYILGNHDIMEVRSDHIPKETYNEVVDFCHDFVGLEIIDSNETCLIIQDLLDGDEFTLEKGLQRMFAITSTMIDDLAYALKDNDRDTIEYVMIRNADTDRMHMLISKQFIDRLRLNKISDYDHLNLIQAFYYRLAGDQIRHIAQHTRKIASYIMRNPIDKEKLTIINKFLIQSNSYLRRSYEAFKYINKEEANNILKEYNEQIDTTEYCYLEGVNTQYILKEYKDQIDTIDRLHEEGVPINIPLDSIKRINAYAANLSELTIDLSQL